MATASTVSVPLTISTPSPLAAVQWRVSVPGAAAISLQAGPSATAAGKSLYCSGGTCIVAGLSSGSISTGTIANLTATFSPGSSGSFPILFESGLAARADASASSISLSNGSIAVQSSTTSTTTGVSVSALSCPASVTPAQLVQCGFALSGAAPTGGLLVSVSTSAPAALTLPATIAVPAGMSVGVVTGTVAATAASQTVTVTAAVGTSAPKSAAVAVIAATPGVSVSSLICAPSTLAPGAAAVCTVTASAPAGSGGLGVSITNGGSAAVTVPAGVTIPANSTTAVFPATAGTVSQPQTATITASGGGVSRSAAVTVAPVGSMLSSLTCSPASVLPGEAASCSLQLTSAAPTGGAVVTLSAAGGATGLTLPPSVTVTAGASAGTFPVAVAANAVAQTVTVTAAYGGVSRQAGLSVPVVVSGLTCSPATTSPGTNGTCTVTLNGATPSSAAVALTSSNSPAVSVPASVAIGAGLATASFTYLAQVAPAGGGAVTITAALGGRSQSATVTVSVDSLLFLLRGNPSEISSVGNGSPVIPALAPSGTQAAVVQRGAGALRLVNVADNSGMQFIGSNGNANTAFLNFPGPTVPAALFGRPSGEVSFTIQSTRTFAERKAAGSYRWIYDVYDATRRLHWFGVFTYANRLIFTYSAGGSTPLFYYAPGGREDALFGKQVALRVRIAWNSSIAKLYLNDSLVQTSSFTVAAANWTAQSSMTIGATNTREMNGGYYFFDDQLANFQVK